MKTNTIRIFPTEDQICQLHELSDIRMDIWNTLIDIQQKEYETNKRILGRFDLIKQIPIIKHSCKPLWKKLYAKAALATAEDISRAYRLFFVEIKKKNARVRPPKRKRIL